MHKIVITAAISWAISQTLTTAVIVAKRKHDERKKIHRGQTFEHEA